MSTNLDLVTGALRLLGVVGETDTPSAEQGRDSLVVLNNMLELWTEDEIQLGWFEQTSTTADAPLPKWAHMGVKAKLAQALQAVYPASSLAPWVFDDSLNGYGTILRKCIVEQLKPADMSSMPNGSGKFGSGYDITTDG